MNVYGLSSPRIIMDHSILIVRKDKDEKDIHHIREKRKQILKKRRGSNNAIHHMFICFDGKKKEKCQKEKEKIEKEIEEI